VLKSPEFAARSALRCHPRGGFPALTANDSPANTKTPISKTATTVMLVRTNSEIHGYQY